MVHGSIEKYLSRNTVNNELGITLIVLDKNVYFYETNNNNYSWQIARKKEKMSCEPSNSNINKTLNIIIVTRIVWL